jgi:murein endopeptidase
VRRIAALALVLLAAGAVAVPAGGGDAGGAPLAAAAVARAAGTVADTAAGTAPPERPARPEPIRWRRSSALGVASRGRLRSGVRLPSFGRDFVTWDPILRRTPNRSWRRWATDRLVRVLLRVAREHRATNPGAPRLVIGDLSRPRGGDFGVRFGVPGHRSHQNGLDVDVYYPRADRRPIAPGSAADVDRRLAQDLVDRFVAAGARFAFVGPRTGLRGPSAIVQRLKHHDDHVHVRL